MLNSNLVEFFGSHPLGSVHRGGIGVEEGIVIFFYQYDLGYLEVGFLGC